MMNCKLMRSVLSVSIFLTACPVHAETVKTTPPKSLELPVTIENNTRLYTDTKRKFQCVINKDWLQREVNVTAVVFRSPDEVFFLNFSRTPLKAMYNNVPQKARKLSWKEFLNTMQDKLVFQQFSKDIALSSSRGVAANAKVISQEEAKISGRPAILAKIEGLMPQKGIKFEARDITFLDGEDIFIVDARAFFKGSKSSKLEKQFSSIIKQVLNTFESTRK